MFASRIIASFFALGAISAFASPAPVVEKREDLSNVLPIVNTLQSSTASLLPQIDILVNSNLATEANLTPLLNQLVSALSTSTASLQALNGKVDQNVGGSKDDIAAKINAVYADIATTTNNIKTKTPHLYFIVIRIDLDGALQKLLLVVKLVIPAVFALVAVLLKTILGLLSNLGFTLLLLLLLLL